MLASKMEKSIQTERLIFIIDLCVTSVQKWFILTYICNAFAKVQNKMEISGTKVVRFHPLCVCYCTSEYCIGFKFLSILKNARRANLLRKQLHILSEGNISGHI